MAEWNEFEAFDAPGANKDERIRLVISQEFVDTNLEVQRLTPIFQTSAHLLGKLPAINLIKRVAEADPTTELTTLDDAVACFEGIKRPHDDEDNGDSVMIYVLNPKVTIEKNTGLACMARTLVPPSNTVLTALVRTNQALQDAAGSIHGAVTRLEWVFNDPKEKSLPKNFETRYVQRHW